MIGDVLPSTHGRGDSGHLGESGFDPNVQLSARALGGGGTDRGNGRDSGDVRQETPVSTLPAEALALVSGIFPRHPPSLDDAERAAKLLRKVEASVKRFLKTDEPAPWEAWQRPPGQEDLHRDLLDPIDSEKWDLSATVPPELFGQWIMVIGQARKYILDRWPIYDDPDSLGPANFGLADDEYGDVWELVRSLDGIDGILADFESFVLNREQVEALAACFPEFYKQIGAVVREQLTELQVKGKDVPWQKGEMLRVLLSIPDETALVSQPTTQPQQQGQGGAGPRASNRQRQDKIQESRTPAERVEANESAG